MARTKGTYIKQTAQVFCGDSFQFTDKQAQKIKSYFPKRKEDLALIDTTFYVKQLVGALASKDVPLNVKRKHSLKEARALSKHITAILSQLDSFHQNPNAHHMVRIEKNFNDRRPGMMEDLVDLLQQFQFSCQNFLVNPGRPGKGRAALNECAVNLAKVWKKYTGKRPTLQNIVKDRTETKAGQSQVPAGKFLDYLSTAIPSSIASPKTGLANVAKDVIKSMA